MPFLRCTTSVLLTRCVILILGDFTMPLFRLLAAGTGTGLGLGPDAYQAQNSLPKEEKIVLKE